MDQLCWEARRPNPYGHSSPARLPTARYGTRGYAIPLAGKPLGRETFNLHGLDKDPFKVQF